ncbi:unnamed protein product [Natator depressus]
MHCRTMRHGEICNIYWMNGLLLSPPAMSAWPEILVLSLGEALVQGSWIKRKPLATDTCKGSQLQSSRKAKGWLLCNSLAKNAPRGAAGPDAFTIPRLCRDDSRRVRISHEPMYPAACGPTREGQSLARSERGELPSVPAVLMRLGTEML